MTWSAQFISSLESPSKEIHFGLQFLAPNLDYNFSSGDFVGLSTEIAIGRADVVIDSAQITPQRWSINFGGFSIYIVGDLRPILGGSIRRGAIAELIMYRDGLRNRVSIGQLRSITGGRGTWQLEFTDFLTLLQSRLAQNASKLPYWYNAGKTASVTINFNFSSDPKLYVDDITIFEKETGQNGVIFVEDSQHNETDYWTWSSKTSTSGDAGYLTIAATGKYPSLASHDHLHVGDKITSIARLRGRPDYVFARTVMSTGNGTQGPFDDYPSSWGSGIQWNPNLFSVQSLNEYYNKNWALSSGTHEIELMVAAPSNISTLIDAFLLMGMWPVWRQNQLEWRVCQNPNQASWFAVVDHITDRDIISIDNHSIYSQSQSVVYGTSTIRNYDTSISGYRLTRFSGTSVKTLPADQDIERDLSLIYRVDSPTQPVKATADLTRMRAWDAEPFEELSLTVSEKHCQLTAGDIVEISSKYIYGIREGSGDTYSNRRALVLSVRWSPSQRKVNLNLGVMS